VRVDSYGVVTSTGDPRTGGNMATPIGEIFIATGGGDGTECRPLDLLSQMSLRAPVFTVGEVLLLDSSGREISGRGRKPSKWVVEVEYCDTLEEALTVVDRLLTELNAETEEAEIG
jgi:hypothetical protein